MSRLRRPFGGTPAPVLWLFAGSLVMIGGASALFPVVPLYVRSHGGGPVAIGFFVAGPMLANAAVQIPAGRLVDRLGRRPMILGSLAGFASLSAVLAVDAGPLWLMGLLRAAQGLCGGAYHPAVRATLADLTPPDKRAERFGMLQSCAMLGLLIGPAVGGLLGAVHQSLVFACSGTGALLALMVISSGVPETRGSAVARASTMAGELRAALPGWWRTRGILVPMVGLGSMGVIMSMYDVVWPQYLDARGFGTVTIGMTVSVFAVPILLLSRAGGRLADRGNRRLLLAGDLVVTAATAVVYPFVHSLALILGIGVIESIAWVATEPVLYAVLTDAAPLEARGRAMAAGGFADFGGNAVGAAVLGSLYGLGEVIPFWAGAAVLVMAAVLCGLLVPARGPGALQRARVTTGGAAADGVADAEFDEEAVEVARA